MSLSRYEYSLASNFPRGKLDVERFTQEIHDSAITIALDRIDSAGDVVVVWFKAELSADAEYLLNALVVAHLGNPLPTSPKLDAEGHLITKLYPDSSVGLPSVMVINIPDAAVVKLKSWQIVTTAGSISISDIFIGDDFVGAQKKCFLSGGEYRVRGTNGHGAAAGSAMHLAVVDRDNITGYFSYFGMSRTKLSGLASVTGSIQVGDVVTGSTSGVHAEVLSVNGDGSCDITYHNGPFMDGEPLTFTAGATATLGTWDEGDVLEIVRSVRDEWIEDYDYRDYSPGGSREIPAGFYLRIICHNAHLTDDLRVKVSFTYGAL